MRGHRILLVDDDADIRAIIGAVLRPQFEVVEACDGMDALRRLEAYEPDFAIVDAAMPVMDGFHLCEAIRKHDRFRAIPVIFLSAYNNQTEIKRGYASGANLYLTKPIDPNRIIKNIEFTITHERVEPRPKRYSINELMSMDEELQRQPVETPHVGYRSEPPPRPRERQQAKHWQFTEDTPPPGPSESAREERPGPSPGSRASMRSSARPTPPPDAELEDEGFESSSVDDRDFVMDTPQSSGRPRTAPPRSEPPPAAAYAQASSLGALPRVMIVENEDDQRALMEITLRHDYEVTTARDGLEAVQNIVAYQPDLLLIDIMMPRMNGYQLLQSLRRNPAYQKLPVIVVSAKTTPRDREYVFRLGATDFIAKPFDATDLLNCMSRLTSQPGFRVQAKRIPIVEIVEKEYLQAKNKTKLGEEGREHTQKMAGLKEALKRESQRKGG